MAIVPVYNVFPEAGTNYARMVTWDPMENGDEGEPVEIYAYPKISFQMTGNIHTYTGPGPANVTIRVLGSNEPTMPGLNCWGEIFALRAHHDMVADRTHDPIFGEEIPRFRFIKPVVEGFHPSKVGLVIFCAVLFAGR